MAIKKEFTVLVVHGEGDYDTVKKLSDRQHIELEKTGNPPDVDPDVLVVLRDETHEFRIEWPVKTWAEVEFWKKAAGFDTTKDINGNAKRQWKRGAKINISIG